MKNKKILITGGLGFIFSHVTEYFVKKSCEVVVIDNCSVGSHPEIIDGSFKFYKKDMKDCDVVDLIMSEKPDYLVHAAAITDVDYSIKFPYETIQNNVLANLHAFEAARKMSNLKKFLYVSTDEIYGECEYRKKETDIIFPRNPYSVSKAMGSLIRYGHDNTYDYLKDRTAEIRMCNIFGPRQDTRKIMPAIKESIYNKYSIPLHNKGVGYREYVYVKNIPPVIELILEKGDRVYNITLNDGFTVKQLIDKAEKVTGKKVTTHHDNRPGMDMKYQMNNARIKKLGWKPLYKFDEGLKEYLCEK